MKSAEIMVKVLQPYPGLRPFQKSEADVFFGRGEQIDELLATLEDNHVVAVVGASGSGKSSLVRAGLLPALEAGFLSGAGPDWRMVLMRPGNAPFLQLAGALLEAAGDERADDPQTISFTEATLRSGPRGLLEAIRDMAFPPGTNILLLVDQFEEIFRFRHRGQSGVDAASQRATAAERNDAATFVNMLLATGAENDLSLYAVITMRSDFLGDCDAFHGLPEAINRCQFLVPRLRRDQLQETITMPLDLFGATADPGLVNRILNEIGSDPDQLPVMQHLLSRMWSRAVQRSGNEGVVLRSSDYEAVGGLGNALSQHADEAYDGLGDDQSKRVAELMFRCLCDCGAEMRQTRRLVTVAEVAAVADVDVEKVEEVAAVFLQLDRSFLTKSPPGDVTPATTLDISHEALIRQWGRLAEWIFQEGQSSSKYRRLSETASLWKEGHASLLVAPELDIALHWREQEKPTKAWADRYGGGFELSMEFLDASVAEQQAKAERQRRETRRKTAFLLSTLAVVTTLMIIAGILWRNSHKIASELNDVFIQNQLKLGTASIREGRMGVGLIRYWNAYKSTTPGEPARLSARNLIGAWSQFAGRPLVQDRPVRKVAFSRNGDAVLTVTDDVARLWDVKTGEPFAEKVVAEGRTWQAIAVSPDVTSVLVANNDAAQFWDVRTGRSRGKPFPHGETISKLAISADGNTVLTRSQDNLQLWDAHTGEPHGERLKLETGAVVALSPDASGAVIGGSVSRLLDFSSGHSTDLMLSHFPEPASIVAFSTDEGTVITGGTSGANLWNVADRREGMLIHLASLPHHDIVTVAYSRNGDLVLTGSDDNTAQVWNTRTGNPSGPPLRHEGTVVAAAFSLDSSMVLTGSADNTARLWSTSSAEPISPPLSHGGTVASVAFSHDGQTLVTGSVDGVTRLWNWQNRDSLYLSIGKFPATGAVFIPDGETAVLLDPRDKVVFANTRTGGVVDSLVTGDGQSPSPYRAIAVSPDGNTILLATAKTVHLWDVGKKSRLSLEFTHGEAIVAASFGSRGKTILTAGGQTARLWDVQNADRPKQEFRHEPGVLDAALSPDGNTVVIAGRDNSAQLWDVSTGQRVRKPLGHSDRVLAVAFSPDGRFVATGSADNTASIWHVQSGDLLGIPLTHRDAVSDVVFSPDSKSLLTASDDTNARFWNVESGERLGNRLSHRSQVKTVRYGPHGHRVLTIDDGGRTQLWDVAPPAADEFERLRLSIEWRTGFHLDSQDTFGRLTHADWLERKHRLDALDGPCDVRSWDDMRADAEQRALAGQTH